MVPATLGKSQELERSPVSKPGAALFVLGARQVIKDADSVTKFRTENNILSLMFILRY